MKSSLLFGLILLCLAPSIQAQDTTTTFSGLKYIVHEEGDGREAYANRRVTVQYTGYFKDGTVFDSAWSEPYQFVTGHGQVIKGWDEGVRLMSEGSRYTFIIPPKLGYGKKGYGNIIPPNTTLYFEIKLLRVENL